MKYDRVKNVTLVELDARMIELARRHPLFVSLNGKSLDDPRVHVVIQDAYQYMKTNHRRYDAVFMDFPDPYEYNLSKLYSREMFHFIRRSLAEDGFLVFDATGITRFLLYDTNDDQWKLDIGNPWEVYYNTVKVAGFSSVVPFGINLELDNPDIRDALSRRFTEILDENKEQEFIRAYRFMERVKGREFIIRKMLERFMLEVEQGFVMAKTQTGNLNRTFEDFPVDLYVLNPRRFYKALEMPFDVNASADARQINSITRPALPKIGALYKIKLPY